MAKIKGKTNKSVRGAIKREVKEDEQNDKKYIPEALFNNDFEKLLASLIFVVSASIYIYTMYPGLPGGDSGELMATAKDFGVSHPPGYPLFTTMAAIIINFFPFCSTAWKVNLLSATIGALTNVLMYLTVKKFSGSDGAGVLTCGWCGFSRLFWMWNIQGEVFSLSNLFAALIMYSAWRFANAEGYDGKFYEAKLGAFICGLALTNQHTSVLFIAPTVLWVLFSLYKEKINTYDLFQVGLWGLAGLSPYLQLPISSMFFKARVSWGDHRKFSDFKKHLLREDFGTFRLVSSAEQSTLFDNFMVYFNDSSRELTIAVWILFVVGIVLALSMGTKKQREAMLMYVAMFSVYHLVFGSLANIKNPKGIFHGVLERFWLQPSVALCTIAGCGVGILFSLITSKAAIPAFKYIFLSVSVAAVAFQVQSNYYDCNENDNYHFWHYSRHILDNLPKGSILLTSGDFSTNTFRYHTIGEEYRTDVMVMDMQFMQAYWFYICLMPVNWPNVSFPGMYKAGKESKYPYYNLKTFLDENFDKYPIYMCTTVPDAEDSIEGFYEAWPFGMCKKFVRVSDRKDPLEHLKTMPKIDLDKVPLPNPDRYETQTWEYTMMVSMLESYIRPATWLWAIANTLQDPVKKLDYFKKTIEMMLENRKHVVSQIEQGKYSENLLYHFSPLEKQIGHVALILYSYEKNDPAMGSHWDALCRLHWTNFMEWQRDDIVPKDAFYVTMKSVLATKDFATLNIL